MRFAALTSRLPRTTRLTRFASLLAISMGLLVSVFASWSGSAYSSPVASASADQNVTFGIETAPDTLDPNVASSADDALVMRQIFDSLVVETPSHTFKPWLANSWTISPNGETYTFKLKHGVKFQDGTTFDAAAVKSNIERILNPATKSQYAASLLGPVKGATVVNKYTVALQLSSRYSPLLEGLSQAFLGMESPAAVAKYGSKVGQHPVGTGPFELASLTPNQSVVLKANPNYTSAPATATHSGPSDISQLTFEIVPDSASRIGGLTSDQLTATEGIPAEQLSSLKSNRSLAVTVSDVPGATYDYYINVTSPQWSSVAARKALRESINVNSALTTLYFGNYPRAWSVLSPTTEGYDKSLVNSWSYSPSKAEAAFKALGYTKGSDGYLQKDGKDLTLNMVNQAPDMDKRVELDTVVQQQLKQVGVRMLTSALEFTQYAAVTQGDKYDMESFSITTGSPSVLDTIFNSKNQPNAQQFLYNVAHYVSPQMDKWGAQAAAATTPAAADAIYREMQQNVVDNAIVIPLYVETDTFAAQSSLKGVQFDALGYPEFYGATDH